MKSFAMCGSVEHQMARRGFLGIMGGAIGLGATLPQSLTAGLSQQNKQMLVVFLSGGVSQLESWDPKPMTNTGGPFRAIPTAVPGIHISELLPKTARHMDKLSLIRSINTRNGDHGKGAYQMQYGRNLMPGLEFPHLGAVTARSLERTDSPLPGNIRIPGGGRSRDAAYLGPRFASVGADGKPPANSTRHESLLSEADQMRHAFQHRANERFLSMRRTAETDLYTQSYEQAMQLMDRREVFDLAREPEADHVRYGKHDFGQHCLMARRMLENDVPYVQVSHTNYDTHNENFNFHLEQLAEFDTPFSCLINDLHERGKLSSTLVVVMSEFGRTPKINVRYGRDHWGTAWSICLGGAGIQPGAVIGKTNDNGTQVIDREVNHGDLFHTYLSAVGLDSSSSFNINGRELPLADPAHSPIHELIR
ncbi:DUF1501 domain-containing protein [uncultured Rubinisphaera sp.]|uniref:DUF1501 domain-containing protein n=1 Tax=uncultured Rubinisphaera sp. TaxID=1678686 RepID=UPI0030D92356